MRTWNAVVIVALVLTIQTSARAGTIGTTTVTPNSTPAGVPVVVTVSSSIADPSLIPESVNLQRLDASGRVISVVGLLHDDGVNGDTTAADSVFSLSTTILENSPGTVRLRVSAGFRGSLLRAFSSVLTVNITGTATGVTIVSPGNAAYLNTSPVTVQGSTGDPAAQVTINGVTAPVSGGNFIVTVPLNEGPNTLTAVATNSNGTTSTASTLVTLDTTPPRIDIYSPTNNRVTTESTITVTGLVNDIVVGTVNNQQATVTVNGTAAQVNNRTFTVANIPLTMGENTIQVTGVDRAGNGATATVKVNRQTLNETTLRVNSGNGQSGPIRSLLPTPLVAQLLNGSGQPIPNTPVVFRVTNQDGTLNLIGASGPGLPAIAVNTNAQGLASVNFTLGSRAGAGNNLVEASSTGVVSTALFAASATQTTPGLIIVDTGNNQSGVVGQALPLPFIAIVTDAGHNRLANVPVTFTVRQGGGSFNGQPTFTATSDGDGRVMATLKLGPEQGVNNNLVEGTFAGNATPVAFTASGLAPGPADATRISGVVLDNSNAPLPGVTMRLFQINQANFGNIPQQVAQPVTTDAQGQFVMQPVPVGVFKLMADGGTAQRAGEWPTIEYDIITVSGQNNTVGMPIYLPELLSANKLCVSPTTGGTLTIPQAPGFALTIPAGSATFPGGSKTGCVSVTPVNPDKVPMVPGFGQQPRFVVTIQPVGTHFSPPASITIPNVDGLAPRAVTEMYSFDHDLASFVAIGSGTVSDDGAVIKSDPGVGVLKAGWHCGGNPNPTGSAGTCADCKRCQGSQCVSDSSQNGNPCRNDQCKACNNGNCLPIPLNPTTSETQFTFGMPSETVDKINDALESLTTVGVRAEINVLQISGKLVTKECCGSTIGKAQQVSGSVVGTLLSFSGEGKVWPPGPIPTFEFNLDIFGFASVSVRAQFVGGVFLGISGEVKGEVGFKKNPCSANAADRDGCFFANLGATMTPSLSAQIGGSVSVTFDCIGCTETTITGEASLVLGELSWPLNISSVGFNESSCDSGLTGGIFQPGPGEFKVFASISATWEPEGSPSEHFERTFNFLVCEISLSGVSCGVSIF